MTDTLETFIESIVTFLQKLEGAPAAVLVLVSCIVVGYVMRAFKRFPNDAIPVCVILWGGIVQPLIADAHNDTPLRIWMIRNVLVGLAIGFFAWLVHNKALAKLEDRLGLFNKNAPEGAQQPQTDEPKQNHTPAQ